MTNVRPLKIAMLGPGSSPHVFRLAGALAERGHELHVVSEDQFAPFPRVDKVTFHPYPAGGSFVQRARAADQIIHALRPNLLHTHAINHGGYAGVASGVHPHVLTAWGSDVFRDPHRSRFDRLATLTALRAADWVLSSSPVMQAEIRKLSYRRRRNDIMLWGVDSAHFAFRPEAARAFRESIGVSPDQTLIFNPRILAPYYNQHVLLEAWPAIKRQWPNAALALSRMRADEVYERRVREQAQSLGIENDVRWLDTVPYEDLPAAYSAADLIVSLATTDSMPITLQEAMACERTLVATDHPSLREWLADFGGAKLVDPHSPAAVSEGILTMLGRDEASRAAHGREAREIVLARADRETWVTKLESIYGTLVAEKRRGHLASLQNLLIN